MADVVKDPGKPAVVVEPDPIDESQQKVDVTPPVPKPTDEEATVARIRADYEALYGSRIKQTEDRLHGAYRINERLQHEVEELKKRVDGTVVKPAAPASSDPWAGIENGQTWKQEIERLAAEKATAILQANEAARQAQAAQQAQVQTLEGSKQQVITRYPDLDPTSGNPDTPISKAYTEVLNAHPDYLTNPYGPLLAMYAMEETLKSQAAPGTKGPSRAAQSAVVPSRPTAGAPAPMTLTREQKAFCDFHNIKYEDYLKMSSTLDEGATVS